MCTSTSAPRTWTETREIVIQLSSDTLPCIAATVSAARCPAQVSFSTKFPLAASLRSRAPPAASAAASAVMRAWLRMIW